MSQGAARRRPPPTDRHQACEQRASPQGRENGSTTTAQPPDGWPAQCPQRRIGRALLRAATAPSSGDRPMRLVLAVSPGPRRTEHPPGHVTDHRTGGRTHQHPEPSQRRTVSQRHSRRRRPVQHQPLAQRPRQHQHPAMKLLHRRHRAGQVLQPPPSSATSLRPTALRAAPTPYWSCNRRQPGGLPRLDPNPRQRQPRVPAQRASRAKSSTVRPRRGSTRCTKAGAW
jgi:hypothetical protein